jgi:hypothetical protein
MIGIVRVPSLPLVLTKADNHFGTDDTRRGENIDDFQAAGFGNPTSGVEANSKEGASAICLQTFVEQKLDFLLREYLGLSVSLNFHSWCIPGEVTTSPKPRTRKD